MAEEAERLAAEKAAVLALRGSTKAMETVLARNVALEIALRTAGENLRRAKGYVGEGAYLYVSGDCRGPSRSINAVLEEQAQAALKLVS